MKYKKLETFKYTTSKILPSVYDESLSYSELLAKVISYLNTTITNVDEFKKFLDDFIEKFDRKLKPHVIEFLQTMYDSGDLKLIMDEFINLKGIEIDIKLQEALDFITTKGNELDENFRIKDNEIDIKLEEMSETIRIKGDEIDKNLVEVIDFNREFFKETSDLLGYTEDNELVYSNNEDNYKVTTNSIGNFAIQTLIPDNEMIISLRVAVDKPVKIRFNADKNITDDVTINFRYMNTVENKSVVIKNSIKEYEVELTPPPTPTTSIFIKIDKVSVLNFTNVKAYQDLELNINMDKIIKGVNKIDTINNTISTINNMIDVIRTWDMNADNLTYYNNYSCMDYESRFYNGKIPLDCSSFVLAILKGVKYQYQNIITGMDNAYSNYAEENINPLKNRYTVQLAKYADDNGYSYIPNEDFSNAKPGDILFWKSHSEPMTNAYKHIQHVSIFLGMNSKGNVLVAHYYPGAKQCIEIRDGEYMKGYILGARFKLQDTNTPSLITPTLNKKIPGKIHTLPTDSVDLLNYQDFKANTMYTIIFRNYKQTNNILTYPIYTMVHGDGIYKNTTTPTNIVYMTETGYTNAQPRDKIVHFYFSNRFNDGIFFRMQPASSLAGNISYDSIEIYDTYIL